MDIIIGAGVLLLLIVGIIGFVLSRMKVVSQTEAMIVTGSRNTNGSKVIKPGGRAFIIPVIQKSEMVPLGQINVPLQVAGVDSNKIPIEITGVAMVKIRQEENSIRDAAERFGSAKDVPGEIARNLQQVLIGSLRSAIATMTVEDLLVKRETLAKSVRDATESEVAVMGLSVDSLQVLDIQDTNGYIKALGAREAEKVKASARVAQAEYDQIANDAEVTSQQTIAERNRDLELRRATLRAETDRATAVAEAAGTLSKAEQDKQIASLQQETAAQEAILRERQLDIEVRKPADADKYRIEKQAEATAAQTKIIAQADAERTEIAAQADAKRVTLAGDAEASSIAARGNAEAAAMNKKADAYAKYGEAAIVELLINKAPDIARELAAPMGNIEKLTIVSTDGASALPKAVANNFSQLDEVMSNITGSSLKDMVAGIAAGNLKGITQKLQGAGIPVTEGQVAELAKAVKVPKAPKVPQAE